MPESGFSRPVIDPAHAHAQGQHLSVLAARAGQRHGAHTARTQFGGESTPVPAQLGRRGQARSRREARALGHRARPIPANKRGMSQGHVLSA